MKPFTNLKEEMVANNYIIFVDIHSIIILLWDIYAIFLKKSYKNYYRRHPCLIYLPIELLRQIQLNLIIRPLFFIQNRLIDL